MRDTVNNKFLFAVCLEATYPLYVPLTQPSGAVVASNILGAGHPPSRRHCAELLLLRAAGRPQNAGQWREKMHSLQQTKAALYYCSL